MTRRTWIGAAVGLLLVGLLAPKALAQSGPSPEEMRLRLKRWNSLPVEKRQELIRRYQAFKALPAEEQLKLQQAYQRWQGFDYGTRRHMLKRWRQYQNMPPEEQQEFRRRWRVWQSLSEEDKARIKKNFRKFQSLPPKQKRALIDRQRRMGRLPEARPFGGTDLPGQPITPRITPPARPRGNR